MSTKIKLSEKFAFSLYNFKSYKDLIDEKLSKSILYMLIVSTIFSLFINFKLINSISSKTQTVKNVVSSDFPNFYIKNGKFHVDSATPFVYLDDSNTAYILENSADSSESINNYTDAFVFNSNQILCKVEDMIRPLMNMKDFPDINKEQISSLFDYTSAVLIIMVFFLTPILSFIGKLFSAFIILAPATYLLNKNLKTGLGYKKSCSIALYALSFPILIKTLMYSAGITFYGFSFIYYVLGFIYCNLAVNSIKESQNTNINALM